MLRLGPAFEWFVWPIPAILSPFAGVFYPIDTLPAWMQIVSRALPPAYVFEGVRAVVAGAPVSMAALLCGGGLAILYVFLAGAFFARTYRHAVRSGLIVRYSAETVG